MGNLIFSSLSLPLFSSFSEDTMKVKSFDKGMFSNERSNYPPNPWLIEGLFYDEEERDWIFREETEDMADLPVEEMDLVEEGSNEWEKEYISFLKQREEFHAAMF